MRNEAKLLLFVIAIIVFSFLLGSQTLMAENKATQSPYVNIGPQGTAPNPSQEMREGVVKSDEEEEEEGYVVEYIEPIKGNPAKTVRSVRGLKSTRNAQRAARLVRSLNY